MRNHPFGYLTLLAAAAGFIVFAGCGGGSAPTSDRDQVTQVARDYSKAIGTGDYGRACDLMTSEGKVQLEKAAVFLGAIGGCENAVRAASEQLDPSDKATFRAATVTAVRIDGDHATARYVGTPDPVQLRKKGGEWLVDIPASGS